MRISENNLRKLARSILAELFTKKSDFSAAHMLGGDHEELSTGFGYGGGLYDDGGFYEADGDDDVNEEELNEDEEGLE